MTISDIRKAAEVARHHDNLRKTFTEWAAQATQREKVDQDTLVELESLAESAYIHGRIAEGIRTSIRATFTEHGLHPIR